MELPRTNVTRCACEALLRRAPGVLALLGLGFVPFWGCVFSDRMLFQRDIELFWNGTIEVLRRCLAEGTLPLWNPYQCFGQPLFGKGLGQFLYPTTWLYLFLATPVAYTVSAVGHCSFTALGQYLLLRRLGMSRMAAWTGASLWCASGPYLSLVNMANIYAAAAWLPWAFWTALRLFATAGSRTATLVWALVIGATMFAGSPEVTLMCGAAVALAIPYLTSQRARPRSLGQPLLMSFAGLVLAAGLSAVQWLPLRETFSHSYRNTLGSLNATYWSIHPVTLHQAFLPVPLDDLPIKPEHRDAFFDGREPLLASLYLGVGTFTLAGAAFTERSRPFRTFFALLALVGLFLSLGKWSPVYAGARVILPVLSSFRFPAKLWLLATLAFSVLAAMGVDAWCATGRERRWIWPATAFLVGTIALVMLANLNPQGPLWRFLLVSDQILDRPLGTLRTLKATFGFFLLAALSALLCCAASLLRWRTARWRVWTVAGVCALSVIDVVRNVPGLNPTVRRSLMDSTPAIVKAIGPDRAGRVLFVAYDQTRIQSLLGHSSLFELPLDVSPEEVFLKMRAYPVGIAGSGRWGIDSFGGDIASLNSAHAATAYGMLDRALGTPTFPALARALGLRTIVALHKHDLGEGLKLRATVTLPTGEPIFVFDVENPLPRAYLVGATRPGADLSALISAIVQGWDPSEEVLLPAEESRALTEPKQAIAGEVRAVDERSDRLHYRVTLDHEAVLVVTDSFDPGWQATVDGAPATLMRANAIFRAVVVPAGEHVVEMTYRPRSVVLGSWISGLTLALVALWSACQIKRARRNMRSEHSGQKPCVSSADECALT